MNEQEKQFEEVLDELRLAINMKEKQRIVDCYDKANSFELEQITDSLFEEYHKLIDRGNLIILQD